AARILSGFQTPSMPTKIQVRRYLSPPSCRIAATSISAGRTRARYLMRISPMMAGRNLDMSDSKDSQEWNLAIGLSSRVKAFVLLYEDNNTAIPCAHFKDPDRQPSSHQVNVPASVVLSTAPD